MNDIDHERKNCRSGYEEIEKKKKKFRPNGS